MFQKIGRKGYNAPLEKRRVLVHPQHPQLQREEQMKRDEARKDELERSNLESLLRDFDSLSFYESLEQWEKIPIPQPVRQRVQVTLLRQKEISHQPLPISRKELFDLRKLSSESARLLYLLRAAEQKGMECPYIHQQNKQILERALSKCEKLREAGERYLSGKGFFARLGQLINFLHIDSVKRDVNSFRNKLEAVLLMCRHQEFAQDLIKLRRVASDYTVRTPVAPTSRRAPATKQTVARPQQEQRGAFHFGPPGP